VRLGRWRWRWRRNRRGQGEPLSELSTFIAFLAGQVAPGVTVDTSRGDGMYAGRLAVPGDQEGHVDLQDFRRALAKLPTDQREILILVCASGHTYEEAAAICQVELGTVKSRVNRARLKLIKLLDL